MSINTLGSAKIYVKDGKISRIEDIEYNNTKLKTSKILSDAIKSAFSNLSFDKDGILWIQVFDNKKVKLLEYTFFEKNTEKISLLTETAKKITQAFEDQFNYQIKANPKPSKSIIKNRYIKNIVNGADWFFRQKIYHAKLADIATIALFAFTLLAIVVSISTQSTHALDIIKHLKVTQVVFGGANIAVGSVLFGQSIMNYQKARKVQDKKEMQKAIVQALFSAVIVALGSTAIISFYKNTNPYLLKSLFFSCSAILFYIGANNLKEIQKFRKMLKRMDFKDFLTNMLQITDDEKNDIKAKLKNLNNDEINKWLKKIITNEQYVFVKNKELKLKKKLIIEKEIAMLEERKKAHFETFLGKQLTDDSLNLLKQSKVFDETKLKAKFDKNELKAKIEKAIQLRIKAEIARIVAPILGIVAFGVSIAPFRNTNIQNLIWNFIMLIATLFAAPLNYKENTRNVTVEETKKSLPSEQKPLLSE